MGQLSEWTLVKRSKMNIFQDVHEVDAIILQLEWSHTPVRRAIIKKTAEAAKIQKKEAPYIVAVI